ncbi:MAG: hypothetical protein ACI8Q9_001509 [Planctomycetota bacterium]|jgi:hypothetical protein
MYDSPFHPSTTALTKRENETPMKITYLVRSTSVLMLCLAPAAFSQGAILPGTVQDAYLKAPNTEKEDRFGYSVAISGDTMVVGAYLEDSSAVAVGGNPADNSAVDSGAAYVYVRSGSTWVLQAYLKASNTGAGDKFGRSVAIDGDTIIVGAPFEKSDEDGVNGLQGDNSLWRAGAVYVYRRTGSTWAQEAYVKASNSAWGSAFGSTVAISADSMIVGSYGEGSMSTGVNGSQVQEGFFDAGAAYVYSRVGSTWSQQAYLKASNTMGGDLFGISVDIDGDRAIVGAPGESSTASGIGGDQSSDTALDAGAAYLFERTGPVWNQVAYAKASNTAANDEFGRTVCISGDSFVVGASAEDGGSTGVGADQLSNTAPTSGAAYVFSKSGAVWAQDVYIKASNTGASARFSGAMAFEGNRLLIGAPNERAAFNGVDGDGDLGNFVPYSGAMYSFERIAGTWEQRSHIKAGLRGNSDLFGFAVALSGDLAVSGSHLEDSAAVLVDGNPKDNSTSNAGAAYAFDLAATCGSFRYGDYQDANVADLYSPSKTVVGGSLTLELSDFTGNGVALLAVSTSHQSNLALGGTIHVDLNQLILGQGGFLPVVVTAGKGQVTLPIPAGIAGMTFFAQTAMVDPLQASGLALSNGLQIAVCP